MKFILTRHTTTDWNVAGRKQGHTDIPLNKRGRAEAEELAKELVPLGIHLIVSSDLKRASETAEIIGKLLGVPLRTKKGLRECAFGNAEGLTRQEAIEKYGSPMARNYGKNEYHSYDFRPFGGEHRDGVLERHMRALESFSREEPDKVILLVGHGRGMGTLLAGLGHTPDLKRGEYRVIEYYSREF